MCIRDSSTVAMDLSLINHASPSGCALGIGWFINDKSSLANHTPQSQGERGSGDYAYNELYQRKKSVRDQSGSRFRDFEILCTVS